MDSIQYHQIENCCKSNKYNYFIIKILQFLVPISLLSLLLSYTSGFSFMFSHNFTLLTVNFPIFYHALERKYMFLICNGILAFLAKSLSFSSTSSPGSDTNVELTKGIEPVSELLENEETPLEDTILENVSFAVEDHEEQEKYQTYMNLYISTGIESVSELPENEETPLENTFLENSIALAEEDEEEENGRKEETNLNEAHSIDEEIKSGVLLSESEGEEEDYEEEENETLIGSSSTADQEGNEVNINTEELNKKFEEFIRKMKEEIRIEAQRQLIAV